MIKEIEVSLANYNSATMNSAFTTRAVDKTNVLYAMIQIFEPKC